MEIDRQMPNNNEFDTLFGTTQDGGDTAKGAKMIRVSPNAREGRGGYQINITGATQKREDGKNISRTHRVLETLNVDGEEFTLVRGDNGGYHATHQNKPELQNSFVKLWKQLLDEDAEIGVAFEVVKAVNA
jgi:hypothetical protein